MKIFEVHITGNSNKILQVAKELDVKAICINLLRPDKTFLRNEWMTSQVIKANNFDECKKLVFDLREKLIAHGVEIVREKIESAYYPEYVEQSLYIETYFQTSDFNLPVSQNASKTTFLATDRTYLKKEYEDFLVKYKGREIELALLDINPYEDEDWLSLYYENDS